MCEKADHLHIAIGSLTDLHVTSECQIGALVNNPSLEPQRTEQFIAWDLQDTSPLNKPNTPHSKTQKIATGNYMKTVNEEAETEEHIPSAEHRARGTLLT